MSASMSDVLSQNSSELMQLSARVTKELESIRESLEATSQKVTDTVTYSVANTGNARSLDLSTQSLAAGATSVPSPVARPIHAWSNCHPPRPSVFLAARCTRSWCR